MNTSPADNTDVDVDGRGWRLVRSFATWSPPLVAIVVVSTSAAAVEQFGLMLTAAAATYAWLLAALFVVYLRRTARQAGKMQFTTRQMLLFVTCVSIVLSVLTTNWPLRFRFELSRGAVEAIANRVEQGGQKMGPQRAGLLYLKSAEVNGAGQACLWTDLAPGGNSGFVRCRPGDRPKLNLWSSIAIDERWYFVAED